MGSSYLLDGRALAINCPTCAARAGQPCKGITGRDFTHQQRDTAARLLRRASATKRVYTRRTTSRPSEIRAAPLVQRHPRPFGPTSTKVIELLAAGVTRNEAAKAVGIAKSNVRVIELRARRRGMLAGVETRVEPESPCAVPISPKETT